MWTTIPALNQVGGAQALRVEREGQMVQLWATFSDGAEFKFTVAARTLAPLQGQALARTSDMPFLRQTRVSGWGSDDILYVMHGSRVIVVSTSLFGRAARIRL
jgi:hypothetical protein